MISLANDCDRGVRDDGDGVMTVNAGKHFFMKIFYKLSGVIGMSKIMAYC